MGSEATMEGNKPAALSIETRPDSRLLSTPRGLLAVKCLGPDIVHYRFEGHIAEEMFTPSMVFAERAVRDSFKVVLIGDGELWQSYEPGYRNAWTTWMAKYRRQIRAAHLLTKSSIVRMGAEVINLALGAHVLHVYRERIKFEAEIAKFMRSAAPTK
jgi:hypothetical protein